MRIHVSIVDDEAEARMALTPEATSEAALMASTPEALEAGGPGECLSVVVSVEGQSRFGARPLDAETIVRNIVQCFAAGSVAPGPQYLDRLALKSGGRILFVKARDVDWIAAEGNYVLVHVGKATYTLRESIGNLEQQLDPALFRRIHRSTIVNVERIRELRPQAHGDYKVTLDTGTQLSLSRGYRETLNRLLDKS